jgi:micrococcal nuclease
MKSFIYTLLFLMLAVPALAKEPIRTIECMVDRVIDGDTVSVVERNGGATRLKIRLYGIDAPEADRFTKKTGKLSKAGQLYGKEAAEALESKVGRGQVIIAKITDIDRYKRLVGILMVGNRNINREMVAEGWAWAYKAYLNTPYRSEFLAAEEQARAKKLGLWQDNNPEPPWEFRRLQKIRE